MAPIKLGNTLGTIFRSSRIGLVVEDDLLYARMIEGYDDTSSFVNAAFAATTSFNSILALRPGRRLDDMHFR